jgi:hypothetical protein
VERVQRELVALVRGLRRAGHSVCAYGAAAKGTVLLNATGLGRDDIEYVCDRNPHKQGRLMPGVHIPIVAPEQLKASHCLLLVWNLLDEVLRQQADYRARGGKFIIPIPNPRVIS